MPLDSILVAIAVTMIFVTFALVLGWGERRTRKAEEPRRRSF